MPKPSSHRLDAHTRRLDEHRRHPQISLQQHLVHQSATLWDHVRRRHRIYLDTRFWIWLRDAAMGRAKQSIQTTLLDLLRRGVRSGFVVCPIGDGSLLELLRQSDLETRLATARVMDELSLGVAIQNAQDRLTTEVLHFVRIVTVPSAIMIPPVESVWLKAAYALGIAHPVVAGVNDEEQLALAKAFLDLMWSLTLEELLTDTPELPHSIHAAFLETATELTAASREHTSEIRDWNSLYADEVLGFFDAYGDDLQNAFLRLYELRSGNKARPTEDELRNSKRLFVNAFSNLIRLGKAGTALPRAQIEAGIHAIFAGIERDRSRPRISST